MHHTYQFFTTLIFCLMTAVLSGQSGHIYGTITDKDNGDPLIGASISVENTSLGTLTNYDGSFVL